MKLYLVMIDKKLTGMMQGQLERLLGQHSVKYVGDLCYPTNILQCAVSEEKMGDFNHFISYYCLRYAEVQNSSLEDIR